MADIRYELSTPKDILAVAKDLRASDRRELSATCGGPWDPVKFAQTQLSLTVATTVFLGQKPVAILGATVTDFGVAGVGMYATNDFQKVGKSVHKFLVKSWLPALKDGFGVRYAEARSMSGHGSAHMWLKHLGFCLGCKLPSFGVDPATSEGVDFLLFQKVF